MLFGLRSVNIQCNDPMLRWINVLRGMGKVVDVDNMDCFRTPEAMHNFTMGQMINFDQFMGHLRTGELKITKINNLILLEFVY